MHFAILFLSLLSFCSAIPHHLATRDASQLLATISDLNAALADLTLAVNNFDGSLLGLLPQALKVVGAEIKVDITVLKATHIAEKGASFTSEESAEIVQALASQIGPIQDSLNALKAKYPKFKKTLTAPVVLFDLKTLKKHTDNLIAAISAKVTPDNAGLLQLGQGILDQAFDDAIAVYSA